MEVDQQSSTNGEFMKTDLQQVIYVKRKQNTTSELRAPEFLTLQQMLAYKTNSQDLKKAAEKANRVLTKVDDPSIQAFLKTFCCQIDSYEILTDLLMQEGCDYFQIADQVKEIIERNKT